MSNKVELIFRMIDSGGNDIKRMIEYKNVRENRKVNQEWTIQKHWQHCAHNTQGEDNQNAKKSNTEN